MISPRLNITSRIPRKIKWGVAGCGRFMEETFLPTLQSLKRSKLVSVYSGNAERSKFIASKFGAQNHFSNFDEFLKSDFEVLYIASANADHYWQIMKAAEAGKHIFCEKPVALNSQQAEEIASVCEKNNIVLMVNYTYRFHPLILKAKELIDKELIGKIVSISANFNIDFNPGDNFRFKRELSGGGALRDLGTHLIDLFRFFNGEIEEVKGYTDNVIYKSDVEDFSCAVLKFAKSGYGYLNVSFNARKAFNRIEIIGCDGSIGIDDFIGKKNISSKLIIDLRGEKKKTFRFKSSKQIFILKALQKVILKKAKPQVTAHDALVNMKIMEAIEKDSLNKGTKI
jgi:D-xylose 1-dehydrogenase (NADP+, D-xylono-1,5-lactone-forming)